jgi:hypothetical protein
LTLTAEQYETERILADTGVCARWLGWDYDEEYIAGGTGDASTLNVKSKINEGTGGIREDGPHAEMVAVVDDMSQPYKLMLTPRESYKSTLLQSLCVRLILKYPNIRILYGMKTYKKAAEKILAIRNQLESWRVTERFGTQKRQGSWAKDNFTVATRTDTGLAEPTMQAYGPDKTQTGGHYDIIINDDVVDDENIDTPEGFLKVERHFQMTQPLKAGQSVQLWVGTPYAEGDLYWKIENEMGHFFQIVKIPSGIDIEKDSEGRDILVGEPNFAHLPIEKMREQLKTMKYRRFCSQYLMKIVTGIHQPFRRADFRFIKMRENLDRFQNMTGYLLTDFATLAEEDACYSTLQYYAIDKSGAAYLVDCRVGRWLPTEVVNQYFDVMTKWADIIHHAGELIEKNACNNVYKVLLHDEALRRGLTINIIEVTKAGANSAKDSRIERLEPRVKGGKYYIADTVPKTFVDISVTRELYNPAGYIDPETAHRLPSGEIINAFVRFPTYPYKDIPDCAADLEATNKYGGRICRWIPPGMRRRSRFRVARAGDDISERMQDLSISHSRRVAAPVIPSKNRMDQQYRRLFGD